jgi:hypothetical protein
MRSERKTDRKSVALWVRLWLFAVAAISLLGPAIAAAGPPNPSIRKNPDAWIGFLIMAVLAVVVIFISLLPSKRSHQD